MYTKNDVDIAINFLNAAVATGSLTKEVVNEMNLKLLSRNGESGTEPERYLTLNQASEMLGVTKRRIHTWRQTGILRTAKINGMPRIPYSSALLLIDDTERTTVH